MKNKLLIIFLITICLIAIAGCDNKGEAQSNGRVLVYNWGEYIDPEVLTIFEEETGIEVIYDEFETNESMYTKVESGASEYDIIIPSDYMVAKMIDNNLLAKIDINKLPNAIENIGEEYYKQSKEFDPTNEYSIPYMLGTVGILYNTTMVDEPIDSWDILWDEKYKDSILMQDSVRDAFMVALKKEGFSMNTTNIDELNIAKEELIKQKPLVQAYVIDQVRDKMIGDEAALAVIYSGEVHYTQSENENLAYVIPKEGTNVWIDSFVIPKNAPNSDNAYAFIDFMCRPDIALKNFEFITYSTPNIKVKELLEDEDLKNSEVLFPNLTKYDNLETFRYLGEDNDSILSELWKEIKSN